MANETPQNFSNHVRWDPSFHFFALPVVLLATLMTFYILVVHHTPHSVLMAVFAVAIVIIVFKVRLYALKVQTRVIRLEERLRLSTLLAEPLRSRIPELTENQLVALRFASDAEVAGLVEETLAKKLSSAEIKKQIKNWRADTFRV